MVNYWFTADEHYGHVGVIDYCNRPFSSVEAMNDELIRRNNNVVGKDDVVIHAGDFCWRGRDKGAFVKRLTGNHAILEGSHGPKGRQIWEKRIDGQVIVVCHYAMRTWPRSHYNSWQLHGHSHGRLDGFGKQMDVGVDTNSYYPYLLSTIAAIMRGKPDNFNFIQKEANNGQ